MEFINIAPPFEIPPFKEMTRKEAMRHFKLYLEEVPLRISYLKEFYARSGGITDDLDLSPQSLLADWKLNN